MRTALVALVVAAACKEARHELAVGDCIELAGADRRDLRASPDGKALYWLERVVARDYTASETAYMRLVRFDFATRELVALKEHMSAIVAITDDGVLATGREGSYDTLFLIGKREIQTLVPEYFGVKDVEPIRGSTYAVLANADNKSSVFLLDLAHPRAEHLTDADVLFGASTDSIVVRDNGGFVVDLASGQRSARDIPNEALPDRDAMWFVDGKQVKHRTLRDPSEGARVVVGDQREWSLVYQGASTIARARDGGTWHAYLLASGKATRLPQIRGGTSIVGTAMAGGQLWALIGHNTSNYAGDLWTSPHEDEVCRLDPDAVEMSFATRTLPKRYAMHDVVFRDAEKRFRGTTWQLLELDGEPPTLYVDFRKQDGGDDLDALRAKVREVNDTITKQFGDRELRTELHFRDGRSAIYRWRRDRLRARASAGMGNLLIADPTDFDLAISDHVNKPEGDRITCRGKLTSLLRGVTLVDLEVRCVAGDRERTIQIAKLEPNQTVEFAQTFEAKENDYYEIEVFRGRTPLVLLDRDREAKDRELLAFFKKLHDETKLAHVDHRRQSQFYVLLENPEDKAVHAPEVRTAAERLEAARALFEVNAEQKLELQVVVANTYYTWNGEELVE